MPKEFQYPKCDATFNIQEELDKPMKEIHDIWKEEKLLKCMCLSIRESMVKCIAHPLRHLGIVYHYQPTEEILKKFCQNPDNYFACPRLLNFQRILYNIWSKKF